MNKLDRVIERYHPNTYPLKAYSFYGNLAGSIFGLLLVTYNLSEIEYNSRSQLGRAVKLVDLFRSERQTYIQYLHDLSSKGSKKIPTYKDYSEALDEYYSEYKQLKASAESESHSVDNQVGITIGISFLITFVPSLIKQLKYIVSNPYH